MKTRSNFMWATVIAMTILIGIGASGRPASVAAVVFN